MTTEEKCIMEGMPQTNLLSVMLHFMRIHQIDVTEQVDRKRIVQGLLIFEISGNTCAAVCSLVYMCDQ